MQARGGFVENQERARLPPFGEVSGQLKALGFSAAQGITGWPRRKVIESDIDEQIERGCDAVMPFGRKGDPIASGHFEHVTDGSAADPDLQDVRLKAVSFAFGTTEVKITLRNCISTFSKPSPEQRSQRPSPALKEKDEGE